VRRELLALREREQDDRPLGEVVERREPVVLGVVVPRAVGHLDDQPPGLSNQEREREVARDQVRVDRQAEQPQAVREVVFPHGRVPLDQELPAPDVVDQHIQAAPLATDALDERLDLRRLQVVDLDSDPLAARGIDEVGGFLDRLRPVVLRAPLSRRATGAIDRRARLTQ
jgi:hypothetical protein